MPNEKMNRVIEEFEGYLKTVNRFYKKGIYVNTPDAATAERGEAVLDIPQITEIVSEATSAVGTNDRTVKKETVEVDLFGNVINTREEWENSESLAELYSQICNCQKCALGATRNKFVFGVGYPNADIVFIGEAPGADEDAKGEPFVGRAGQLLNKIIVATGFKREDVFICNILKCRPPANRNPLPDEVEKCRPYLDLQLKLVNPKLILLLGKVAAESLLKTREPLNKLRGKVHDYKGRKVMITFHPAALLRNPDWKRPAWEDMKQFKALYDEMTNSNNK